MKTSTSGIALIKRFEGFSETVYIDAAGHPTIGYGHCLKPGESFNIISEQEAERLLTEDLAVAERAIEKCVKISLSQGQYDALASFVYNVGSQAFEKSYLLRLLNENNPDAASEQFGRWVYAGGRKLAGLIARRAAEKAMFCSVTALS
jgi:lysozyme